MYSIALCYSSLCLRPLLSPHCSSLPPVTTRTPTAAAAASPLVRARPSCSPQHTHCKMLLPEMFNESPPPKPRLLHRQPTPFAWDEGQMPTRKALRRLSVVALGGVNGSEAAGAGPGSSGDLDSACGSSDAVVHIKRSAQGAAAVHPGLTKTAGKHTPFGTPAVQACTCYMDDTRGYLGRRCAACVATSSTASSTTGSTASSSRGSRGSSKAKSAAKAKLKAVGVLLLKGLGWSARARPVLPVPIWPPVVV